MESSQEIKYRAKPNINAAKLPYIKGEEKEIYVNLFQIKIKKPLKLFQYPFEIVPEVDSSDLLMKSRIFKHARMGKGKDAKKPKAFYGECFISGDSLYGMNEVKEPQTFTSKLHRDGEVEYTIKIQPKATERTINQNDIISQSAEQPVRFEIEQLAHSNISTAISIAFDKYINKNRFTQKCKILHYSVNIQIPLDRLFQPPIYTFNTFYY